MKKRIFKFAVILGLLAALMFAEYRFIMRSIVPSFDESGILTLSVCGQVDVYRCD